MINKAIIPYIPKVIQLFEKHKIEKAYIFGSALSNHFNEESDVDFLVSLQKNLDPVEAGGHLWDLIYELEELLQRKVDLITERSLKNPYFIKQINENKLSIYG